MRDPLPRRFVLALVGAVILGELALGATGAG
jgi:hypothetical protein